MADGIDGSDVAYQFSIGGDGCERCQGLDGSLWPAPPPLPHSYCECEIEVVGASSGEDRECGDNQWSLEQDDTERYGPQGESMKWHVAVTIECWDGATSGFESVVDFGVESDWGPGDIFDDVMAFAWNAVSDEAEEYVAQFCTPCDDPPLIS
jgi:hypothetical protein